MGPPEDRHLPLEAEDRAVDVRLAQQHAGVVDQVAGGEVVRAVDDHVVVPEQLQGVRGVEPRLVGDDLDVRVEVAQALGGGLDLRPAHGGAAEEDLAVEVALVDHVEVDQAERADPRRREVEAERRAEAAGADHQHLGRLELALPQGADLGEDQVAAVVADLARREVRQIVDVHVLLQETDGAAGAPGDRRDDRQRVPRLDRSGVLLEMADVLVVEEEVDEAAQRAVVGIEMALQGRVEPGEVARAPRRPCRPRPATSPWSPVKRRRGVGMWMVTLIRPPPFRGSPRRTARGRRRGASSGRPPRAPSHGDDEVGKPRPRVLAVEVARPRRMVGM